MNFESIQPSVLSCEFSDPHFLGIFQFFQVHFLEAHTKVNINNINTHSCSPTEWSASVPCGRIDQSCPVRLKFVLQKELL